MKWFWVRFYYANDGYYDNDTWELVAAESEEQIREYWKALNFMATVKDVVALEDKPIPRTPRRTKHPRCFDPRLVRP
jgi:hypothetical protein